MDTPENGIWIFLIALGIIGGLLVIFFLWDLLSGRLSKWIKIDPESSPLLSLPSGSGEMTAHSGTYEGIRYVVTFK